MPANVIPIEPGADEPPTVYQAAIMKTHELRAVAIYWKKRAAWAFTAGLFAGTAIAGALVALLGG